MNTQNLKPWVKGQSGNPNGRKPNSVKKLLWDLAKEKGEDGRSRLKVALDQLMAKAEKGDLEAIKYVCDRLEGKPAQMLEHTGEGGSPIVVKFLKGPNGNGD